MANALSLTGPGPSPRDLLNAAPLASGKLSAATKAKAKASSQDFEAVFVNSMFQQMFAGIDGEGPFGGSGATGVWRSFLADEYSKSFVKAGGLGIADQVYRSLMAQQEIQQ